MFFVSNDNIAGAVPFLRWILSSEKFAWRVDIIYSAVAALSEQLGVQSQTSNFRLVSIRRCSHSWISASSQPTVGPPRLTGLGKVPLSLNISTRQVADFYTNPALINLAIRCGQRLCLLRPCALVIYQQTYQQILWTTFCSSTRSR